MKDGLKPTVLVVDDEESICKVLGRFLKQEMRLSCDTFSDPEEALKRFGRGRYSAAIVDVRMPRLDGLTLMTMLHKEDPHLPVIVLTALDDWETAVNAMRLGAFNFINKPFSAEQVESVLAHALEQHKLNGELREKKADVPNVHIIGKSAAIRRVLDLIKRVSPTDSTVLVTGESGTGKELVARAIHLGSPRRHNAFVAVNCGAFPDSLLESELFGHVKGAFTSAVSDKTGMFEVANKGTFFLDEIGETSQIIQVKLLRVLETHEVRPVGATKARKVDTRVIAATNRNLEEEVEKGNFRYDLFYRLNVIPIHLPPLRERREDIPLLVGYFVSRYAERTGRNLSAANISPEAWEIIEGYSWPGNVRELENVINRAFTLMEGDRIKAEDLGIQLMGVRRKGDTFRGEADLQLADIRPGFDLEKRLEEIEISYIKRALEMTDGVLVEAAKLLGLTFRALRYKVRKYGIKR